MHRALTGLITLDEGYVNTGATTSAITFLDGEKGVLRYRGAPDADSEDPGQNASFLRLALDAVLDGRDPDPAETPPLGCSIKWKA